jgi:plasmid stabilization system protein ParE
VREAVERFVDYDEWFVREVDKGLAAADRGERIDHEEVGKLIDRRYPGKMRIRWTEPAVADLTSICDYIEEHDGPAPRQVGVRLYEGVNLLTQFPLRGEQGPRRARGSWCFPACRISPFTGCARR